MKSYEIDPDRIQQRLQEAGFTGDLPDFGVHRWTQRPLFLHPAHRSPSFKSSELQREQCAADHGSRLKAPFDNAEELARRARLEQHEMKLLAAAGALATLSGHRRQQVWDAAALHSPPALLEDAPVDEDFLELQAAPEGEDVLWDYASLGLTLRSHPMALLRHKLDKYKLKMSEELLHIPDGRTVRTAGIVTLRQQPDTAKGTIFVSLEDEHGATQVICWRGIKEKQREVLLGSKLLAVKGRWQKEGEVCNLIADRLADLTPMLGRLATASRDFR